MPTTLYRADMFVKITTSGSRQYRVKLVEAFRDEAGVSRQRVIAPSSASSPPKSRFLRNRPGVYAGCRPILQKSCSGTFVMPLAMFDKGHSAVKVEACSSKITRSGPRQYLQLVEAFRDPRARPGIAPWSRSGVWIN